MSRYVSEQKRVNAIVQRMTALADAQDYVSKAHSAMTRAGMFADARVLQTLNTTISLRRNTLRDQLVDPSNR